MNALKTGFCAHDMATSVVRLGEDRQTFVRHLAQLRRLFAPYLHGEEDEEWVLTLAQACWRRLRLYRAQSWEQGQLVQFFQTFLGIADCRFPIRNSKLEARKAKLETRPRIPVAHNSPFTIHPCLLNRQSTIVNRQLRGS